MEPQGSESNELFSKVEELLGGLMSAATGAGFDNSEYQRLRSDLLAVPRLKSKLPAFLRTCRDTGAFWSFIKPKFARWEQRRQYLRTEFEPALRFLEDETHYPSSDGVSAALAKLDSEHVATA